MNIERAIAELQFEACRDISVSDTGCVAYEYFISPESVARVLNVSPFNKKFLALYDHYMSQQFEHYMPQTEFLSIESGRWITDYVFGSRYEEPNLNHYFI
jgi:hypothetical protein